uniref:Uncharacterized protein n=1 Tax=Arundo donax TaxID=35708 RepID=A0A0A9G388_ARUDO
MLYVCLVSFSSTVFCCPTLGA